MYDENLSILEDADYAADMFWLGEEDFDDSSSLGLDEEMNMVTLDQAINLIKEMSEKFDTCSMSSQNFSAAIGKLHDAAYKATVEIEQFIDMYNKMREREF